MNRFVASYGHQDSSFKDKMLLLGLTPLFEAIDFTFYIDGKARSFQYCNRNDVHLVMTGIVTGFESLHDDHRGEKMPANPVLDEYLRRGMQALESLEGSFSVVVWDGRARTLHVCRDDGGAKLIYYYSDGAEIYFSNKLEVLARLHKRPAISSDSLNEYLRFLDITQPHTIYDNIFLLQSDQILSAGDTGLKITAKKVETPQTATTPKKRLDLNANLFKDQFVDFIRKRLDSVADVGVFLSGGIDSSLVCAAAASIRKDITAYTVGFHASRFDESPIAQSIARYLGIRHEVLKFTTDEDLASFVEFTSKVPSPFADPAIIPTFQSFRHVGTRANLMLDGTGADTLIGVTPPRHIEFILNYSRHVPAKLRKMIAQFLAYSSKTASRRDLFDFDDAAELLIRWKGWSRKEITALRLGDCSLDHTTFYQIYDNNRDKTPFELYSMLMAALPDERIHFCSSIFGPDVVFPFFDRTIQAFVRNLPLSHRYANGITKVLFRKALESYLPRDLWNVPKHGFDYPFADLLRSNGCELVNSYLSQHALAKHEFFDKSIVKRFVQRFTGGDRTVDFKIWGLVVFQAWYQNFYEKL
jgi:asparagine synthase (glutamine-hydrolysing)